MAPRELSYHSFIVRLGSFLSTIVVRNIPVGNYFILLESSHIVVPWLDFEFDHKNILFARIDRKRKLHATVVLSAMGYTTQELSAMFYHLKLSS